MDLQLTVFLNKNILPEELVREVKEDNDKASKWIDELEINFKNEQAKESCVNKLKTSGFIIENFSDRELLETALVIAAYE